MLATGLAQAAWMLSRLAMATPDLVVTTQPGKWQAGKARLLLAEAFVSGAGKPVPVEAGQHAAGASAAGRALVERLGDGGALGSGVRCAPHNPLNLLAATAPSEGLVLNPDELHKDVLVVRVKPVPAQRWAAHSSAAGHMPDCDLEAHLRATRRPRADVGMTCPSTWKSVRQ